MVSCCPPAPHQSHRRTNPTVVTYEIRVLRSLGEPMKKTYSVIAMAAIALGSTSIATNASGADDPATPRSVADYTAPRWIGKAGPTSAPPSGQVATYKMNVEAGTAEYLGTKPTGDTATRALSRDRSTPRKARATSLFIPAELHSRHTASRGSETSSAAGQIEAPSRAATGADT